MKKYKIIYLHIRQTEQTKAQQETTFREVMVGFWNTTRRQKSRAEDLNNSQDLGMEFLVSWQVGGGRAGVALRQCVQLREQADRHQVATN